MNRTIIHEAKVLKKAAFHEKKSLSGKHEMEPGRNWRKPSGGCVKRLPKFPESAFPFL